MTSHLFQRIAETPAGSTIDALENGHYWMCDRNHVCKEVIGLWEAEEFIREQERNQGVMS